MAVITHSYFLPIYFQAVKGTSAAISGVYGLPFTFVSALGTICAGFHMTAYGYYVPFMWIGSIVYLAGSVVYYLLQVDSNPGKWVGCQVLAGVGFGISIQVTFIAVQVVTPPEDMPTACSWEVFFKSLGGAVGISVAQTIFSDVLLSRLKEIPGLDAVAIINAGAADVSATKGVVPVALVGRVKFAYSDAITRAFIVPIAVTALAVIFTWGLERRRIEKEDEDLEQTTTPDSAEASVGSSK
jgi:MFS family permease